MIFFVSHTHTCLTPQPYQQTKPPQVDAGVLKEGLISVGSKNAEEPDPLDPEIIKRFDNRFQYRPYVRLIYVLSWWTCETCSVNG